MAQSDNALKTDRPDDSKNRQSSGLAAFQRERKKDSRERMLAAAIELFGKSGYYPVSVEDISLAAGVSRMTFYRHFRNKADIALILFDKNVGLAEPQLLSIRERNWNDREEVGRWLSDLFAMDRENRMLLQMFVQASVVEPEFTKQAHEQIGAWIDAFGESIPAFSLRKDHPQDRRRWLEAWLLIYEILDQSNHAALDSGVAGDPLLLEILIDRFINFTVSMDEL